ncbi:hypothetical protein ALT721_1050033 [Alteromonas alvinellae]
MLDRAQATITSVILWPRLLFIFERFNIFEKISMAECLLCAAHYITSRAPGD